MKKPSFEVRVQRLHESPGSMRVEDPVAALTYWREKIVAMPWHDPEREVCVVLLLNTRYRVLCHSLVSLGSVNETMVHPRDVFRAAVAMGAYAVLLMHNHPSGDASPSTADHAISRRLAEAGRLLQITLLDHVIVGAAGAGADGRGYYSFKEAGLV